MKQQWNALMRRATSWLLVFTIVLSFVSMGTVNADAAEPSGFAGKTISILGDSISTFEGVSNNTSYNTTLAGGNIYYHGTDRGGVKQADTWWQQTIDQLGLTLLVNNSWSGSAISHTRYDCPAAYISRAVNLHNDNQTDPKDPDIVAVFLGTNDLSDGINQASGYKSLGAIPDYAALITENQDGTFTYAEPTTVAEAYAVMIHKITVRYPNAELYCLSLLPRENQSDLNETRTLNYNNTFKSIAENFGGYFVDQYHDSGITEDSFNFDYYMYDSLHPTQTGMDAMTTSFVSALQANSKYSTVKNSLYDVTYTLGEGCVVAGGTDKTAVAGEKFSVSFAKISGYKVEATVTMGGQDITSSCYADGTITIPSVTGDITITAKSEPLPEEAIANVPKNFHWKYDSATNAMVSVSDDTFSSNSISKTNGTITDGALSSARFTLGESIVLNHDQPWVVEWKSEGSWSNSGNGGLLVSKTTTSNSSGNRFVYRRSTGDFIALGEYRSDSKYHNYGANISSVANVANTHVWKMENRIAADGSNMIYLYVDGAEVGAMNRYYINGTSQNKTDNWVAGKNFTFNYFGTSNHPLSNVTIDYIKVWEAGIPNAADTPKNFHWKYDAQSDSMVNVTDSTFSANSLTMTNGSIANGQLTGGRFTLGETIDLDHDQPWVIEWKSKGTWTDNTDGALLFAEANNSGTNGASYFYRRHNSQFFAIGHYDGAYKNYAALLTGIDAAAEHVWKMENRINQDGSNMVYLYVDGTEVGAMNQYYKGGTYQNTTNNWVSGQDFDFKYMGTTPHTIGGCSIDYIKVWEAGIGADKSALEKAVKEAKALVEEDYTAATWEAVETALAAAETVLADDDAEQTAVDAAEKALTDAVAALVEVVKPTKINLNDSSIDWTKAELWGRSKLLTGSLLPLPFANNGKLTDVTYPATHTKNPYVGNNTNSAGGAIAYYGDTSGVKVMQPIKGDYWTYLLLPCELEAGEAFEWTTDIKFDYTDATAWFALTVGEETKSASTTVSGKPVNYETLGTRLQMQFRMNGEKAGVSRHNGAEYKNYTSGKAPACGVIPTIVKDKIYTLKATGGYKTIDGKEEYVLNLWIGDYRVINDWQLSSQNLTVDEIAGKLAIESSGVTYEISYNDTVKTAVDTTGYDQYIIDKNFDFSGAKLHDNGVVYDGYVGGNATYTPGMTGIKVKTDVNSGILLPIEVKSGESFVYSVPITITDTVDDESWLGLTFGGVLGSNGSTGTSLDYTYHANMRICGDNAALTQVTTNWETEAPRWANLITLPRSECPLELGKTYIWKLVVTDGHLLDFYIDDTAIVRDIDLSDWVDVYTRNTLSDDVAGYLGIDGSDLTFAIGYSEPEGQYEQKLYTSGSAIKNEALVAWDSDAQFALQSAGATPALVGVNIDKNLAVTAADGSALTGTLVKIAQDIYAANAIPMIYVDDQDEADALVKYLFENALKDVMVVADDLSVLESVMDSSEGPRGIYDLSASDKSYTEAELEALRVAANSADVKIIMLSEESASYETVKYLQAHLMTVWGRDEGSALTGYTLLTNGVDGIVTDDYADVYADMNTFTGTNVLLRVPTVSGHRGSVRDYADHDAYYNNGTYGTIQENTVEALIEAAKNGAEAVEFDVFLTKDNVVVMHHNANTNGIMTAADGSNPKYDIRKTNYYGVLENMVYIKDGSKMDTLEELFACWKQEAPGCIMYLEIKDPLDDRADETVAEIKRLVDKYNVADQTLVITFQEDVMQEIRTQYAGTSLGCLMTTMPTDMETLLNTSERFNSTWNVSYSANKNNANTLRNLYARGIGLHGWTIDGTDLDAQLLLNTYQSLTTNDTWKIPHWANHITVPGEVVAATDAAKVDIGAAVINWLGEEIKDAELNAVTVSGNGVTANADGTFALVDGSTVVMLQYVAQTENGHTYTLYSNPVTITDKSALQKAVDDAKALDEDDYTTATWADVEDVLADAEEVLEEEDALQPAIDAAEKALEDAVAALVERGDKTELQKAVDDAKALDEDDYTTATWADVEEALADAEAVLADVDALQPAIDAAEKALEDAVAALVERGDKTELQKAVNDAKALDEDDYTAATWADVEEALADAEAVLADVDALQPAIDAAKKALTDAVAALVERGDKTELQKAVDDAKALDEDDYTTATWADVEDALADAEEVLAEEDALQPAIDSAKKVLTDAVAALVKRGDKTELQKAVDDAKALNEDDYTTATWADVEDALADAEEVLAEEDALQPAIDAAKKALTDAVAALVERGDKTELAKAVKAATALAKDDYTADTWAAVEDALADAEAVLAEEDATQRDVDAAEKALEDAVAALKKPATGPETGDSAPIVLWTILLCLSAAAVVILKKKEREAAE